VVVTYDRSELIQRGRAHASGASLLQEMLIVSAVIVIFLFHFRSALIPILTLPIAVLLAFIPMARMGLSANIMSLGGIAVAIGAMVDASIIMVENVHKKLEAWEAGDRRGPRDAVIVHALQEVGRPIFFALLVITVVVPAHLHARGDRGSPVQATGIHKGRSRWRSPALLAVTLTPGARGLVHSRSPPCRERASTLATAGPRVRTRRAFRGPPPPLGAVRGPRCC